MMDYFFRAYRATDEIYLEENTVKTVRSYNPVEPIACLIEHL